MEKNHKRSYLLNTNYLKIESNWESCLKWSDQLLLPYIKIGTAKKLVAILKCHFGIKRKIEYPFKKQIIIHMAQKAELFQKSRTDFEVLSGDGTIYRVNNNHIDAYYPNCSEKTLRDPARLIREILYNKLPEKKYSELHASAIALNSKIIAFVGEKGAGKTTIISYFLGYFKNNKNIEYVSNDRLWISINNAGEALALGTPMPVLIGYGTMLSLPELIERVMLFRDGYHILNKEWDKKKHEYSAQEFARIFNTSICIQGKLSAVIYLKQGKNNVLEPIENNKERMKIFRETSRDASNTYPNWLKIGQGALERTLISIPNSIPMYKMNFDYKDKTLLSPGKSIINMIGDILD